MLRSSGEYAGGMVNVAKPRLIVAGDRLMCFARLIAAESLVNALKRG